MLTARTLMAELAAAFEALDDAQRAWLEGQGIDKIAFLAAGGVGVTPIVAWADGRFEPAGEATAHAGDPLRFNGVVMGVFAGPPAVAVVAGPSEPAPACLDQVAFDPRAPERWWRRTGIALALGEWVLAPWGGLDPGAPRRVRLCATPLSWLRALGEAAEAETAGPLCLLGPIVGLTPDCEGEGTRYLRDVIEGAEGVVCDDEAHAARVHAALRKRPTPKPLPGVFMLDGDGRNEEKSAE